ncbi:MAG: DUF503 domain-containing protein [Desulfobacter sp.]|nr:DUF503 domain-containing protein [Desulfobacter sp.]WDP86006.1 MAG: DUF503 domain-containing protein [Desulfobacter sp.]
MVVGTGQLKLKLFGISSLKAKRKIVKSMIARISNTFHVSIAETDLNDSLEWAQIGFAIAGRDARKINSQIDKIFNMAHDMGLAYIADTTMEIIHV